MPYTACAQVRRHTTPAKPAHSPPMDANEMSRVRSWRLYMTPQEVNPVMNAMKRGLPGWQSPDCHYREGAPKGGPAAMLYAGLDLSRQRVDVHLMNQAGEPVQVTVAPPDADGLRGLARQVSGFGEPVVAAIESMNGARFVHDQLELAGWDVAIADAQKVKGLAPLACKTDRIDAWVLAELCRRELVPAVWLPTPEVRAERERARWRLHLVRHRTALKNRVHATLLAFGRPCPTADLFGVGGRALLARLGCPNRGRAPRLRRSRSSTTWTPRSMAASRSFVGWA